MGELKKNVLTKPISTNYSKILNRKKQNISILCTSLASGGAEKVISLLLKELKNDFNVSLVLFYEDVHFPIPEEVKVIFLNNKKSNRSKFLKLLDPVVFTHRYHKLIKKENISISVSFLAFPNLVNGVIAMLNKKNEPL